MVWIDYLHDNVYLRKISLISNPFEFLLGNVFTVWHEGIKEESFEKHHPVFEAMLQGEYQRYAKSLEKK